MSTPSTNKMLDVFACQDMRTTIMSFLNWDEYVNIASVCKYTEGVVSGRKVDSNERNQAFAKFVLEPLLDTLVPSIDTLAYYEEREVNDATTAKKKRIAEQTEAHQQWQALPIFERFVTRSNCNKTISANRNHDLSMLFEMVDTQIHLYNKRIAPIPALADFMNTILPECPLAVLAHGSYNAHTAVNVGNVIHRVMWKIGDYPYWVRFILATDEEYKVKQLLDNLYNRGSSLFTPKNNKFTSLMLPSRLNAQWCVKNGKVVQKGNVKPLTKEVEQQLREQQRNYGELQDIFSHYKKTIEMQVYADIYIPRLRAHASSATTLTIEDAQFLINILKRASTTNINQETLNLEVDNQHNVPKRRRVAVQEDDF